MRKYLIFLMLLFATLFSSCNSCTKEPIDTKPTATALSIATYNDILLSDYNKIKDTFPNVMFYESQCQFDNFITADTFELASAVNVFQAGEYSYQVIHKGDSTKTIKVHDYWLEDVKIDPTTIITLDSALTRLQMADIIKPRTNLMTLRSPLGPKVYNPAYYFGGQRAGFVKVDAITSAVEEVK